MTIQATALAAGPADAAAALPVVGALAATFIAVALYFYLPAVRWLCTWYVGRARQRLARSRMLRGAGRVGGTLWALEVLAVIGCRTCVAVYALPLLIIVVPLFLTLASLSLAASVVVP